jgi:DNA mismatch endonuclease, patch repair protein
VKSVWLRRDRNASEAGRAMRHQCPLHSKVPEGNRAFWEQKLRRNVERDAEANKALRAEAWTVVRIWEHDVLDPKCLSRAVARVRRRLLAAANRAD